MWRKLRRVARYTALALAGLSLLMYVARDPVRDVLGRVATAWVSRLLHGTLTIGQLRGSLLSSLVARDVRVRDEQGNTVAQIAEVRLRYDLLALLTKRFLVHEVDIVRPQASLVQAADGTWNFTTLLPPASPEPTGSPAAQGLALEIQRFQIHDGTLTLQTPALPGVQQVDGLHVHLRGQVDARGFHLHVVHGTAQAQPAGVTLRTLQGAVYGEGSTLRLEAFRLQTAQTLVTGEGVWPGGSQVANLELHLQPLETAEVGRLLQRDNLYGPVSLDLTVQGPPQALGLRGQLQAAEGRIGVEVTMDTQATPWRYAGQIAVSHANLAALLHRDDLQSNVNLQIQIEGEGLSVPTFRGRMHFEAQESHLGSLTLLPSQVIVTAEHGRFQIQRGDLHTSFARLTAAGTLDSTGPSALHYELTADLTGLRSLLGTAALAGTIRVHGDVRGEGPAIQAQGVLEAQQLLYEGTHLGALRLTYTGTELGVQPQVTAQLSAQQAGVAGLSLERLTLEASYSHAEQQLQVTTEVRQSAASGGKVRGTLHWSETHQQLILHEVLLQLAQHAWRLEAPAEMVRDAQGLRLGRLVLTHADERLELAGTLDASQRQDVHLQLTRFDLTFLQRLLALPAVVQGRTSLQVHLAGTVAAPLLDLDLTLYPDNPRSAPFDQLRTTFTYDQQQLRSDIRLRQANRDLLSIEAHLPLDLALTPLPLAQRLLPQPVALQIRVKQPDLAALSRWQPTWPGLSGTLEATLKVQGMYTALALDAEVRLQQVGLRGAVQQVNAPIHLQATLELPATGSESLHAPATAPALAQLRKATLRLPTLRGQLVSQNQTGQTFQVQNLVAQASGRWTAEGLEGALESLQAQVSAAGIAPTEVALAGRLSPQQLELTQFHVRLPQSEVRGHGVLTLPQQQLQLRLDIPRLRLDEIGVPPPSPLPAFVQGVVEVRGSVAAPQVETRLHYAGGQLVATLAAQLQDAMPRYQVDLRLDDLDVAALLPGAQGKLRASLQAQGLGFTEPQRRAEVDLRLETNHLSLAPGLTARLKGTLSGTTVRLEDLQVRSTPVVIVASGTFAMSPGDKTSVTYAVTLGDLTPLQQYLGTPLQAQGSLNGTLQGTWPALQARSRLQVRAWTYATLNGQRLQADLALSQFPKAPQATVKAQVVDLRGPNLLASSIELQSTYNTPQGTVQLKVTAGPYQKTGLEGRFTLAAEQQVTLTQLHLRHNGVAWDNATPLTVVRRAEGRIELQRLLLRSGRQELSAQGILIPDGTIEASVQLQRVQLLPHLRLIVPDMSLLDGQISLQLGLRGTLAQPLVEGALDAVALRWQQHEVGDIHGQFSTAGTSVQLDLIWQEQMRQILRVTGTVSSNAPHALALHLLASEVDLRLAQTFSTAVTHSTGRLNLDVRLTGTPQQPSLDGTLALRDGALQLAATGTRYTDLQAQMVFTGTRVEVTQFHAVSGDGTLEFTGWATSTGLALNHLECALQAHNFVLLRTPDLEATVSAAVTVRGSLEDLSATGSVTLPSVRAQLGGKLVGSPEVVQPWQLTVESVYGAGPQKATTQENMSESHQSPPLSFLRADLRLDLPQNVWVRGPGTAIELRGALTITKELEKPFALGGSVETVRGFASFYSGKFIVERGRVDFTGSPEINPVLDVVATREVSGYVVSVHVAGRANAPQLHLSSTPELQQADIVTLLVVGKTSDRLTASERSGLSGQAQQIVGNVAAGEVEKLLAKPLGFDTVDIQTGENLGSSKVSVGRYITQNLFLSYEQQLGDESGNKIDIEYSVNRHLKLKGSSTNKGAAALDFLWRIDY